jgi:hypothetical protein
MGLLYRHDPLNWHLLPDGFQAPNARISQGSQHRAVARDAVR